MKNLIKRLPILLLCSSLTIGCASTNNSSPTEDVLRGVKSSVYEREINLPEEHKTGNVTKRDAKSGLFSGVFLAVIKLFGSE